MPIYTLPNLTDDSGLVGATTYVTGQLPFLAPSLLFFLFIIIAIAGYKSQESRTGRGNISMWLCVSSFITTTGAGILYLIPNLIGIETVVIGIALTFIFTLFFIFSEAD